MFPTESLQYLLAVLSGTEPFSLGRTLGAVGTILVWAAGLFAQAVVRGPGDAAEADSLVMTEVPISAGVALSSEEHDLLLKVRNAVSDNPGKLGVLGLQLLELLTSLLRLRPGV